VRARPRNQSGRDTSRLARPASTVTVTVSGARGVDHKNRCKLQHGTAVARDGSWTRITHCHSTHSSCQRDTSLYHPSRLAGERSRRAASRKDGNSHMDCPSQISSSHPRLSTLRVRAQLSSGVTDTTVAREAALEGEERHLCGLKADRGIVRLLFGDG
jgi:hypothetical protein